MREWATMSSPQQPKLRKVAQRHPVQSNGGFFPKKADWPAQHPSIVVAVDNMTASIAKVQAAGGTVLGDPMEIPGVGKYVSFMDPEGNRVSMLEPLPRAK